MNWGKNIDNLIEFLIGGLFAVIAIGVIATAILGYILIFQHIRLVIV